MPEVLASEIMATAGARELRDGEVVVVGLGLPQVACVLAKRKLPEAVAHLTSPGFAGGRSRQELGLRGGGPHRVITDMAVLGFDPDTHSATLLSLHPVVRLEDVVENTGFPLHIPKQVPMT